MPTTSSIRIGGLTTFQHGGKLSIGKRLRSASVLVYSSYTRSATERLSPSDNSLSVENRSIVRSDNRLGVVALILLGLALGSAASSDVVAMEVGKPFPLMLLPSLEDDHPMSIADFRGRKLVLHIWAAW